MLSTPSKISSDDILKYFSYFSQKIEFHISCKLSLGDNLLEMTNPVFWEK